MPINTSQTVGNIAQAAFAKSATTVAQTSQLSMINAQEAKELANETDVAKREEIVNKYQKLRKKNPEYRRAMIKYKDMGLNKKFEKATKAMKVDPSFEGLKEALNKYGNQK